MRESNPCRANLLVGRLLAMMAVLLLPTFVRADDDDDVVSTNHVRRPVEELFKTDVVYPEEKGELELELASFYQNHQGGDTWTIPVSMEYGLSDFWQVEAEWDSLVQRFPRQQSAVLGVGDLELGTQYSFMNIGGSTFHLSPRFSVQVPVGDVNKGLSEGLMEYEPELILAKDFPEWHRTQIFTEVGAGLVQRLRTAADADDAEPAAHELDWGTGIFVLYPHATPTLEFNWANNTWNHHGTENEMYLTPGFLWRLGREVELGLGVPIGLNNNSDRFEVVSHIVWEF